MVGVIRTTFARGKCAHAHARRAMASFVATLTRGGLFLENHNKTHMNDERKSPLKSRRVASSD